MLMLSTDVDVDVTAAATAGAAEAACYKHGTSGPPEGLQRTATP